MRRLILVSVVGMLIVPFIVTARAQAPAAPAFASKVLVDNDRVRIQRLSVPAGFRESLQVVAERSDRHPGDAGRSGGGDQRSEDCRSDRAGDDVLRAEERAASVPQHGQGAVQMSSS